MAVLHGGPGRRCVVLMNQSSRDDTLRGVRPSPGPGRGAVSSQFSWDKQWKRSLPGTAVRREGRAISRVALPSVRMARVVALARARRKGSDHTLAALKSMLFMLSPDGAGSTSFCNDVNDKGAILATPTCPAQLATALVQTYRTLVAHVGPKPSDWVWGRVHTIQPVSLLMKLMFARSYPRTW